MRAARLSAAAGAILDSTANHSLTARSCHGIERSVVLFLDGWDALGDTTSSVRLKGPTATLSQWGPGGRT